MTVQTVYESAISGVGPYSFQFEYQKQTDVVVSLYNPTTESYTVQPNTEWSLTGGGGEVTLNTTPDAQYSIVRIERNTDIDTMYATFYQGSAIRSNDLNENFEQLQFALQEQEYESGDVLDTIGDIQDEINDINDIITDLSGITILSNVTALNAYDPPDGSVGSAVQVSNSTGWSGANNVTGTPGGFAGDSNLRVNLRITNADTPTYAFISYSPVDPDARYVNLSGDTMTGSLVLNANPTANLGAATKQYVDNAISTIPSDNNTTYDFGAATSGSNVQLQLVGSDSSTDVVTITPGSNITITNQSAAGFTINAAGSAIPGPGNVTITAGTGLTGGGTFNVNQSSDATITLNATGSGSTNLGWSATATNGTVSSDTGTDATLTVATTSAAGLMSATDKTTFNAIPSTYQTQAGMSAYLTTANAATTYQTQAGMSAYYTQTAADNKFLVKDFSTLTLLP